MLATISHPVEQLQAAIAGEVIFPGSERYAMARQAWNLTVDQHPALIVQAACVEDIAAAVRYARQAELSVAVQATGHGVRRPADGALLILTGQMNAVEVDPVSETAWIECGAQWKVVLAATQPYGLAPLLGSSPEVGAVGYTLGGGMGWLARKYGMAVDSVRYFDVVTPDGELVRASQSENPELFWALRGGGGGFGIVVGMEIELYPVVTVYGGNLIYPIHLAGEVLRRFRTWVAELPEAMTASVVLMNFPPIPQVPEPVRGQSVVMVRGCYAGDLAAGEALVDAWRTWRPPLIDDFKAMPFSEVARISSDPSGPDCPA
jgi:FAD/FMN-containing dehydrogenase